MTKRKMKKGQTMIYKTLLRKPKNEQYEPLRCVTGVNPTSVLIGFWSEDDDLNHSPNNTHPVVYKNVTNSESKNSPGEMNLI